MVPESYYLMKETCGPMLGRLIKGASDENFTSWNDSRHKAIQLMVDEVTPQSDFYNNYGTWYKGIRKANLVLERIR